jgi:SPP1 family holin
MKNVTAGTIIRTVLMLLGLINAILVMTGHSIINIEDGTVENLINAVFSIVTTLMAWWKNNSFTRAAIEADKFMKEMKQQ